MISQINENMIQQINVIPATPGYFVIDLVQGGTSSEDVVLSPVIAWSVSTRMESGGEFNIITASVPVVLGSFYTSNNPAILTPDGSVFDLNLEDSWSNIEDFYNDWRQECLSEKKDTEDQQVSSKKKGRGVVLSLVKDVGKKGEFEEKPDGNS